MCFFKKPDIPQHVFILFRDYNPGGSNPNSYPKGAIQVQPRGSPIGVSITRKGAVFPELPSLGDPTLEGSIDGGSDSGIGMSTASAMIGRGKELEAMKRVVAVATQRSTAQN